MMNRLAQSRETLRSGGEFGKDKTKFKLDKLGDISRKGFFPPLVRASRSYP